MQHTTILKSWEANSKSWIDLLQNKGIESRKITNPAIVEVIRELQPQKLLDMGCGEGWLVRQLTTLGITAYGADGTLALIEKAQDDHRDRKNFTHITYEQIVNGQPLPNAPFDVISFNFSLYESDLTTQLLQSLKNALTGNKIICIQTIHPFFAVKQGFPYESQWLEDSWKGLPSIFKNTHKWYFRTFSGWHALFTDLGFKILKIVEPKITKTSAPSSIIFVLSCA